MEKNLAITIPKPCLANWDEMTPVGKDRYCGVCELTVVDFTSMEIDEIRVYFKRFHEQKTCGRFRVDQLSSCVPERKEAIYRRKDTSTFLVRFRYIMIAAMALIALLMGCRKSGPPLKPYIMGELAPETIGEPKIEKRDSLKTNSNEDVLIGDTLYPRKK